MLKVSDTFNSAFAAPDRELRARVTIGKTVYDSDDLTSINYDSGAMTGEQFSIGSTYMNSTKITFSHLVEGLKQLDEVLLEFGIVKADGTTEYVKMGTFIIDDKIQMDRNNNSTTIECMDRMVMLGGAYKSKLSYPATIKSVAVEIANMAGVRVNDTSFARLPNQSINEPIGYSYRDAIGIIAQFAMGFALFDRDGYLDIRTLVDSEFKIDPSQYFLKGLVKNETFFKLNGISCTVVTTSKDENGNETSKTTVLQSGSSSGSQIKLANNVMTQDVLDRMYESLKFTNYYPFTLNWNGNPAVEAGDWLTLEDMQGNEFKVPNMSYTLTFNGGLTASSKAETSTNSSVTYSYGGSMSNIVNEIGGREGAEGNHIYEGTEDQKPLFPKEGDLWYKHVGPDTEEWIYKDGKWEFLTSTKPATDAQKAADAAQKEAEEAKNQANKAVDGANDAVAKAGFANDTAEQAKSDAASALQKALDAYTHGDQIKTGLTADIDAVKGQLSLKANQIDVDKLGGRVTNAEAQIKLQADQIALTVSKTELTNVLGSYATQTWTQSQIKSTADSINLNVSKVQTNLDNLKIGGTNLIQNSGFENAEAKDFERIKASASYPTPFGEYMARIYFSNGAVNTDFTKYWTLPAPITIEANVEYTMSYYYSAAGSAIGQASDFAYNGDTVIMGLMMAHESHDNSGGQGVWKRFVRTFKLANETTITRLRIGFVTNSGNTGWKVVDNFQLEKGNKVSDHSPSPSDYASDVEFSNLKVKVNGIQTTVATKADQSQVTQMASQITSLVGSTNNANLIPNSGLPKDTLFWRTNDTTRFKVATHSFYTKGSLFALLAPQGTAERTAGTATVSVTRGATYTVSLGVFGESAVVGCDVLWLGRKHGETTDTKVLLLADNFKPSPSNIEFKSWTFSVGDCDEGYIRIDNNGSTSGESTLYFGEVKLEKGGRYTPWEQTAESSEIVQTREMINLRVEKGDIINQINISPESILIAGQKVHITGQTTIDNAVIKDAMISDIKADKITAGTLNAANVNVINLNANNITTGTIKGANLSLNLNTGEVLFQKGSIKSTNGNLNIRIDDGSMSLTNSLGNGAYFKDGNIYMTDSDFWTPGNPKIQYGTLKMVPNFLSDAGGGVALKGPNGVVVGTDEYSDTGFFGDLWSDSSGGGITLTKEHVRMTSEGAIGIAGGKMYNTGFVGKHPGIQVGIAGSYTAPMPWFPSSETGDALFLSGKVVGVVASSGTGNLMTNTISDLSATSDARSGYVLSAATYKRTYGSGDTVIITPNGVFGRISSASKYKLAIGEISTLTDEAHQFLSVKPKQWFDKSESEALADSMTTGNTDYVDDAKALPHNGFIAEDLYTAGLDGYVIRSNDGSIESIQYDRLPVLHHELIRELFNRLDAAEMEIYKLKQEVLNNAN